MIDEIQVQNLALIREASLVPSRGLTVLTGETGAGKTALLSALKLLMGERADKSAVREGADALSVSGRFFARGGADAEDHVAVRRVSADGRSRVSIDGAMASVGELARTVAPTIDLCGQHEHQRLLKPAEHGRMLDAWAHEQVERPLAGYRDAFEHVKQAEAALAHVREAGEASSARLEEARFTLRQIDAVSPEEGEYERLAADLARSEHAESLATAAQAAHESLAGDGGALDALGAAISALDAAARHDEVLAGYADSLREATYVLEDVSREVRDYRDGVEFDPEQLAFKQERMAALQGLLRTYGPTMDEVLARRDEAADLISLVDDAAEREAQAQRELDAAEQELQQAAQELVAVRAQAAPRFSEAVTAQMARLEMGTAQLVCQVEELPRSQWSSGGPQSVEFLFRPGASMQPRPLARIASGGEVSRVMLAMKVVLGQADDVDTLVFDEVDAGVGGSVANALAEVLADLARTHQVLVVTHLAQVAVHGQAHYMVEKREVEGGVPETSLRLLDDEERPAEIARMLSGDATAASLAHAQEMLAAAHGE
ncbi:MAG: DNA repair protein RecN [Eggerthellaceae bacterium]|nr:DNA repair protein RecN [Eggerthellaceae bacterium]